MRKGNLSAPAVGKIVQAVERDRQVALIFDETLVQLEQLGIGDKPVEWLWEVAKGIPQPAESIETAALPTKPKKRVIRAPYRKAFGQLTAEHALELKPKDNEDLDAIKRKAKQTARAMNKQIRTSKSEDGKTLFVFLRKPKTTKE